MFTHDTEESLLAAAELINSQDDPDILATPEQLDAYLTSWRYTGDRDADLHHLDGVHTLRSYLRTVWKTPMPDLVEHINAMLREGNALPQLVRHDDLDWHFHATDRNAPLPVRLSVEIAMALTDLVRTGETDRMKACEAEGCTGVLFDATRNKSRRFCSVACGNRVAAAAYRARRRDGVA